LRLPDEVESRVERDYQARFNSADDLLSAEEVARRCQDAAAVLCTPADRFDAERIALLPSSVRILATISVGFNHIDIEAAARRRIIVTNTPDVLTEATADLTNVRHNGQN